MTQKFLVSAFVGALALVGAQAASAEDWVPAGAAASLTVAAPAQVVSADIEASNGLIHVIDQVLIPATI